MYKTQKKYVFGLYVAIFMYFCKRIKSNNETINKKYKNMKKIFVIMSFALIGCAGNGNGSKENLVKEKVESYVKAEKENFGKALKTEAIKVEFLSFSTDTLSFEEAKAVIKAKDDTLAAHTRDVFGVQTLDFGYETYKTEDKVREFVQNGTGDICFIRANTKYSFFNPIVNRKITLDETYYLDKDLKIIGKDQNSMETDYE